MIALVLLAVASDQAKREKVSFVNKNSGILLFDCMEIKERMDSISKYFYFDDKNNKHAPIQSAELELMTGDSNICNEEILSYLKINWVILKA